MTSTREIQFVPMIICKEIQGNGEETIFAQGGKLRFSDSKEAAKQLGELVSKIQDYCPEGYRPSECLISVQWWETFDMHGAPHFVGWGMPEEVDAAFTRED
jgi:hypothetical protein